MPAERDKHGSDQNERNGQHRRQLSQKAPATLGDRRRPPGDTHLHAGSTLRTRFATASQDFPLIRKIAFAILRIPLSPTARVPTKNQLSTKIIWGRGTAFCVGVPRLNKLSRQLFSPRGEFVARGQLYPFTTARQTKPQKPHNMLSLIIIDFTGNEPEQIGNFLADTATISANALRFVIADKETRIAALGVLAEWDITVTKDGESGAHAMTIALDETDYEFAISAR